MDPTILRQMVDDNTVTLAAATAAHITTGLDDFKFSAMRLVNLTAATMYFKFEKLRSSSASASTTNYSFTLAAGAWVQLDVATSISISAYSAGGGNVLVEVFG